MKIQLFSLLLVAVALYTASCSSRKSEPVKAKSFTGSTDVVNGEKVYMVYCHKCHPAGEAGLGPAINSNPAPQFIKRFQMRHGLGVMPGFGKEEISKEELRDISAYLKAWKSY